MKFLWLTELSWAIELCVMHQQWLNARGIAHHPERDGYYRVTWVRMCMRLGDGAAYRIVSGTQAGRKAAWLEGK